MRNQKTVKFTRFITRRWTFDPPSPFLPNTTVSTSYISPLTSSFLKLALLATLASCFILSARSLSHSLRDVSRGTVYCIQWVGTCNRYYRNLPFHIYRISYQSLEVPNRYYRNPILYRITLPYLSYCHSILPYPSTVPVPSVDSWSVLSSRCSVSSPPYTQPSRPRDPPECERLDSRPDWPAKGWPVELPHSISGYRSPNNKNTVILGPYLSLEESEQWILNVLDSSLHSRQLLRKILQP